MATVYKLWLEIEAIDNETGNPVPSTHFEPEELEAFNTAQQAEDARSLVSMNYHNETE